MKKLFVLMLFGLFLFSGCTDDSVLDDINQTDYLDDEVPPHKPTSDELAVSTADISNYAEFSSKIPISAEAVSLLEANRFVVISNPYDMGGEDITAPYEVLKEEGVPIFITTDSLLHLYHIQFDETLRQIEEREFYEDIWDISIAMVEKSEAEYNSATDSDVKEAWKKSAAYFSVGLMLLQPTQAQTCMDYWCESEVEMFTSNDLDAHEFSVPEFVEKEVNAELGYIDAHSGFSFSPIFFYKEDYSQYVPRGHYTRSEKLKNYFKAMMWYGRMTYLLKSDLIQAQDPVHEAKIQTMSAVLIADEIQDNSLLKAKWDRIYDITSFYVGYSDDLGFYEYMGAANNVFGDSFDPSELDADSVESLKIELAEYPSPLIYGGTGACEIYPPFTSEQADECLENTKGFRLMGQRFVPDSYMFTNLVFPYVEEYEGSGPAFTEFSGMRVFPRGLDVMALLGSARATELLNEMEDSNYKNYDTQFAKLQNEFDSFAHEDWNKNLYWSWLYSLKPLFQEYNESYPLFMRSKAWEDKSLTTALASWTELRHDTILYAKQSYTMEATSMPMPEPELEVVGYVEPNPEFYSRLLTLTQLTNEKLESFEALDSSAAYRLSNLEKILERLKDISERELAGKELSESDYEFIEEFGEELNGVISQVEDDAKKTTIVADVHTDANTRMVLEEGVGYVDLILVAYEVPDGRTLIGAGPVMSYYEFKQPMSNRLTDEAWRELLQTNPPEKPKWIENYSE